MSHPVITAVAKTTGFEELDRKLEFMATAAANRIATAAVRAGLRVASKFIVAAEPLTIRKGIVDKSKGVGVTTKKKASNGASGKVGVGVGKTQKNALAVVNRGRKKGVGVSARNLHWFAMGTENRMTGEKRIRKNNSWKDKKRVLTGNAFRFTGKISVTKWGGFVQRGMSASTSAVFAKMAESVQRNLARAAERGTAGALEGLQGGN